jgi:hypothetical protein
VTWHHPEEVFRAEILGSKKPNKNFGYSQNTSKNKLLSRE